MADPMTVFRRVRIEGPDAGSDNPLWQGWLDLGYEANAPADNAELRNHSIRLLLQRESPRQVHVQGQADVFFQEPLLLVAAVTTVDFRNDPATAPFIKVGRAQFTPFALAEPSAAAARPPSPPAPPRYSELRVAPRSAWPPTSAGFTQTANVFELAAPRLRATRGRIRVGCARDAEPNPTIAADLRYPLTKLLAIDWSVAGDYVRIFGGFLIRRRKTAKPVPGHASVSDAIAFDLTPEGIEFDVIVPDPFLPDTTDPINVAGTGLSLRLRLVPFDNGDPLMSLQLELVDQYLSSAPGASTPFARLNNGLASMSRNLADSGGCLLLQVDTDTIPPLTWPLTIGGDAASPVWICDNPGGIPAPSLVPSVRLLEKSVTVRLLTREDFDGGEPGVAEFSRHKAVLSPRRPADGFTLNIASQARGWKQGTDRNSPDVTLTWSSRTEPSINPDKIGISEFSGIIEADPLAARLAGVWAQAGAIAGDARPPYAFIALDRGWAQMPLPPPQPAVSLVAEDSAFRGYLRLAVDGDKDLLAAPTDQPTLPGLEIVSAQSIEVDVSWTKPDVSQPRTIVVKLNRAAGTLDGALWAGEGSPSPTEILPPLDAGPAALASVPISFGVIGPGNWQVDVKSFEETGLTAVGFSLPLFPSVVDPLLVWQPHPTLALVSSIAMTRTADSAMRPSATRELVPAEVLQGPLLFTFDTGARLPYIADLPQHSARGDGRWRWPWPRPVAAGPGPYPSSPAEAAGVALASLTLPGVEFIPALNAAPVKNVDISFSLRFDLPILDELFANSKAPDPTRAVAQATQSGTQTAFATTTSKSPTALDMVRLSGVWTENARRLARARTEADRAVLKTQSDGTVQLWHPFTGLAGGTVYGIVEPYIWKPTAFAFSVAPASANPPINLGAYCLGDAATWYYGPDALGGLPDTTSFSLDANNELQLGTGDIKVNGFAASSFKVQMPFSANPGVNVDHLQDARGLSLAMAPDTASQLLYTSRTVTLRKAPNDHQTLVLATVRRPVTVKVGGSDCYFWFRDLPLKQNTPTPTDPGVLIFDISGGLETGFGPDPAAINRYRLARTLYEWSFYGPPQEIVLPASGAAPTDGRPPPKLQRGRFEFDLAGPLAARPLRLHRVGFDANGNLVNLEIVVSVQYKSPPSESLDVAPFAADTIYATGNLATMVFEPDASAPGGLVLTKFDRCELRDPSDPLAATDPFIVSSQPISLVSEVVVYHGPASVWPSSKTQLIFDFKPQAKAGAPDIAAANLRVRLFGQDCNLDTTNAGFSNGGLTATFKAPSPASGVLALKEMKLVWPSDAAGAPALFLAEGSLDIPLRNEAGGPIVFSRDYKSGNLHWLGLSFQGPQGSASESPRETIDHDLGVVTIDVDADIEIAGNSPALFRGLFLPNGHVRGAVAVVFKTQYAVDGQSSPNWPRPVLGSAFVEFAFNASATSGGLSALPQRISAIRHRHVGDQKPAWNSHLLLDAAFAAPGLNTSSVSWPVGRVSLATPFGSDLAGVVFNPDATKPADWKATLRVDGADDPRQPKLVLSHIVRPRLCAHRFPTGLLGVDPGSGEIILQSPWSFRAVVDHTLQPASGTWPVAVAGAQPAGSFTWSSIDELTLFDMKRLVAAAALVPDPARDRYAFLARYKDDRSDADIRIAGVARRALADAGFPVEYVMQALKTSTAPPGSLVLTGAAVTEVVTSTVKPSHGVPLVLQWILPWAPMTSDPDGRIALDRLGSCPQADHVPRIYNISLYDAAAGTPRLLDGSPVRSFAAQDGTQSLIEARMSAIVGGGRARTMVAVDQAILEPADTGADYLYRPLFPRTLLALSSVSRAFGDTASLPAAPFSSRISCVTVLDDTPLGDNGMPSTANGLRHAEEIRFSVTAWSADVAPTETPPSAVTLIVADDASVKLNRLPADMAATLVDPTDNSIVAEGQQRADATMRALGLSANPRVVILASVDTGYLTIHEGEKESPAAPRPLPHVSWLIASGAQPVLTARRSQRLRKLFDTLYASPALGWPSIPRADDQSAAHASLGREEVRRNTQAWAGRVRTAAWPAIAWDRSAPGEIENGITVEGGYSPDDAAEVRGGAFVTTGQRVALRRAAAKNLRSAPDRLSVLAPARARAPTVDAMATALKQARNPVPQLGADRAGLAPMLPGSIETTVTGQRPGVMLTQFEGVLLTSSMLPFDPEFSRFGRPAWRAPLTVHQVRAPRSSELPETPDLTVRRRTFVAADETEGDHLKPFKIMKGPAQIVRFDRMWSGASANGVPDIRSPHAVTLTLRDPDYGRLAANWDGMVRLLVTVPDDTSPDPSALVALARIGLWPLGDTMKPRAELLVGNVVVVFTKMTCYDDIEGGPASGAAQNPARLLLELAVDGAGADAARVAVAQALRDSTADTPVRLTIRGVTPISPGADDRAPASSPIDLSTAAVTELLAGPPNVVVFDLPHIPTRQRWLDVQTFTVAFGDPAYDRELGSPANNTQFAINDVPHILAVDRAEYDPSAKIYLAFWKRQKGTDKPAEAPDPKLHWSLTLQIVPGDGSPARLLQIAATKPKDPAPHTANPRYLVDGLNTYAIPLSSLRELPDPKSPATEKPVPFATGDRLQLTVSNDDDADHQQLMLSVGIIAEPVLPPPASTYGLATLQHRIADAVGTSLFATAPLPQAIDFPDLLNDLIAGHVRRRGIFLWPFATGNATDLDKEFAYLVKVDRTGGGQLPRQQADFRKCDG
jgi:hypothetical protein